MILIMKVGLQICSPMQFFSLPSFCCMHPVNFKHIYATDHLRDIEEEFVIEEDGPKDFETMQFIAEGNS